MNGLTFELVIVATVIVYVNAGTVNYYATKYDHLDVEQILNNRRMVNYYSQCLLSKGPCPPQGLDFKRILPEALETNCLRCTEKQKAVTYRTIKRLKKEYPKIWAQLQAQWDPNDVYVRKFEESYRNTPTSTPSENEILLDDRFGVVDVSTKKTTLYISKKTPKPKYPAATSPKPTQTTSTASVHNFGPSSVNNIGYTPYNTQNPNIAGSVATNQVGGIGPDLEANSSHTTQSHSTVYSINHEVTIQTLISSENTLSTEINPLSSTSVSSSGHPVFVSPGSSVSINDETITTSQNPSSVIAESMATVSSSKVPFSSTSMPQIQISTENSDLFQGEIAESVSSSNPVANNLKPGITFDFPKSSMNHPQVEAAIQKLSSTTFTRPSTTASPKNISPITISWTNTNRIQPNNIRQRQPDVISQVLSSILNNRPPTISIEASVGKPSSNDQSRRPGLQIRFPNFSGNTQGEGFNPVGNFVRGITSVGGQLIETGTSIADTVLSSVRTLFAPPRRVNRKARKILPA